MLTFTHPSALLALLGLLVPLAIHLWNRRPGREVAVGSLRWLAAGANRRLRNLRLEQLGLLLLRATLLAVLAAAVAGPAWRRPRPAGRGQVLLSPSLAGTESLTAVRPVIDSLRRQGYTLRWLSQGLPRIPAAAWRSDSLEHSFLFVALGLASDTSAYEARIGQAADAFPGQPLYVLTPAQLAGAQGTHHRLPPELTWHTLPLTTETTWLQAATGTADSLHLVLGHSTERQTSFRLARVARPQPGQVLQGQNLPTLRYEVSQRGLLQVQPVAKELVTAPALAAVPVRPARVRAWVYATAAYADDARYLRAALRAASVGLPGPLDLTVASALPDTAAAPDWLFWLSAAPVPTAWRGQVRRGLHLWQSAAGPGTADTTQLIAPGLTEAAPALLWRRADLPAGAEAVWTDAQDRAVLTRQAVGRGELYQAAIRLNTAWSTLPDSPALPAMLLDVLRSAPTGSELARLWAHDQRRLDPAQLPMASRQRAAGTPPLASRLLDLRPWLVLAVGFLLALERWLARRTTATSLSTG